MNADFISSSMAIGMRLPENGGEPSALMEGVLVSYLLCLSTLAVYLVTGPVKCMVHEPVLALLW